tara:strand:+ start:8419 stop:9000 length:582 start_codon:yes stop_codon:yes gene_type:complete
MKRQKKIQLTLISIGAFLILLTYFYYPIISDKKIIDRTVKKSLDDTTAEQSSTFENVEYKGLYDLDKPFIIQSEKAYILNEDPDVVYMNQMHVILYLKDGRVINITSDKGRYNKVTYDCFFEQNVKAEDGETKIFAENLDLLATENSVEIYNKVNLNNPEGFLFADKINYDFETKYFKVSMFEDEKVKMKLIK